MAGVAGVAGGIFANSSASAAVFSTAGAVGAVATGLDSEAAALGEASSVASVEASGVASSSRRSKEIPDFCMKS